MKTLVQTDEFIIEVKPTKNQKKAEPIILKVKKYEGFIKDDYGIGRRIKFEYSEYKEHQDNASVPVYFRGAFYIGEFCGNLQAKATISSDDIGLGYNKEGGGDIGLGDELPVKGKRVATYFLSQIIDFLQTQAQIQDLKNYDKIKMKELHLASQDKEGENGIRRNTLYQNLGYTLNEEGTMQEGDVFLKDLTPRTTWQENITVYDSVESYKMFQELKSLKCQIENLEKKLEQNKCCLKKFCFWK